MVCGNIVVVSYRDSTGGSSGDSSSIIDSCDGLIHVGLVYDFICSWLHVSDLLFP